MELIISIVIWSAIVYRLSTDVAYMDGPFDVFSIMRGYIIVNNAPSWIIVGVQCPICISFWITCILVAVTGTWEYFAVAGVVAYMVRREG